MKRIVLFITAVLLFAGCAKEQLVDERSYTGPVTVIEATFESLNNGATKANVTDAGIFTWQNGDKAAFTVASGSSYLTGTNSSTTATAVFSINGSPSFTSSSFAFYPSDLTSGTETSSLAVKVPTTREWVKDQTNVAMYGVKVENEASFNFSHMGGLVRVRVNNVPTNARKFVFKTPDYKISGDFTAVEESGFKVIKTKKHETENPVPESEQTYTLYWETAPNAENTMDFYIPLPLGTYANGFAFKFLDGTDAEILSKTSSQSETIARKDLVLMPAITLMGGEIETAEKAAVVANIPAGYSGDFLLPQSEKVLLKINAPTGTADHDITLKYDEGIVPTNLEIKVIDGDNEGNYNATLRGNLPSTHVEFTQGHIDATELTTSSSTLAVINPATVGILTVKGGNVLLQGATVNSIVVDAEAKADGDKAPVEIVMEKVGDNAPSVTSGITANADVIVAPKEATIEVQVTPAANVNVATEGEGTVKNGEQEITTKAAAKIGEVKYITLADAIAAVQNGQTITMIADVTDANGISVPAGNKTFTVDFGGHPYTCLDNPAGSTNTTNQVFQLNAGNTITFKNGTIKVADTNKTKFRFIIQNYADLTLEDMTLDGTNLGIDKSRYTLSNNAGNINLTGNTTIKAAAENGVAFDIYHWEAGGYPTAPVLTWNSTGTVDGIIELSGGDLIVNKDLALTKPIKATEQASTLTVNANIIPATGWTSANASDGLVIVKRTADLTIDGTAKISYNENEQVYCAVKMTEKADADGNTENRAKLTVKGTVTLEGYNAGISGNGNSGRGNTDVTVEGGTIKGCKASGDECCGIYQPQVGTLTINGGTIEGLVGVYVKSGSVTTAVSGGTIKGTGAKGTYSPTGNGFINTGDAIVFDNCGYPGGAPNAEILGGTFTSAHGDAVASYAKSGNDPITGFIKGGTFSTKPADDLLASGYAATENGGVWTVAKIVAAKIGETTYSTLKAALDAAVNNDVIVLCMDIIRENVSDNSDRETYDVSGKTITLDLNGHTIKHRYGLNKKGVFEVKNATLTIDDSSIEKNGKIADTYAQAVLSAENSVVNLKNGILAAEYSSTSSTNYRVVKLKNTTFTMDGGSVLAATTGSYNRAFEFVHSTGTNSKVIVNNGIIKTFTSYAVVFYGDSGGYQGENNTVEINGGEISTQGNYGWLGDDMFGEITMNGGSFTSNWHQVVDTNTTFTYNGGTVNIKSN